MGQIRGWMLKQKVISGKDPNTVWENRGIRKCSKVTKKCIHVGYGNNIVVEKKRTLSKDASRSTVENKCRSFMKKHPYGVK